MATRKPTISIFDYTSSPYENNTYRVIITGQDPLYEYRITENGNVVAQRYNITQDEYIYEIEYEGHITEDTSLVVEAWSYTSTQFESEAARAARAIPYLSPYKKLDVPKNFKIKLLDKNTLSYSFYIPNIEHAVEYCLDICCTNSLNPYNRNWSSLTTRNISSELIEGTIDITDYVEQNKYTLLRVQVFHSMGYNFDSDYGFASTSVFEPGNTYLTDGTVLRRCISRMHKDDQWRQCNITPNMVFPLLNKDMEQILDTNNKPIFIAKKGTI